MGVQDGPQDGWSPGWSSKVQENGEMHGMSLIFKCYIIRVTIPVALTIAGSDPSGGAGIQADLKTFHQRGVYGASVITLLTVQNTRQVSVVEIVSPQIVAGQLQAVLEDIPPSAAKTGALGDSEIVRLIAEMAQDFQFPLVVDPVMISKHGNPLMNGSARAAMAELLLPRAFLVTPNLHEAGELAQMPVFDLATMKEAAIKIASLGAKSVLIKGGHLEEDAVDVLYWKGEFAFYKSPRIHTSHTHGTGCTYSACITAELAKGRDLAAAVDTAKRFITLAIETNPGLGKGSGPVNHHARIEE
jgi:hydroxymethylpyrimidine/phosphomethylpyrimidine kinase